MDNLKVINNSTEDPDTDNNVAEHQIKQAVGAQIRRYRKQLKMTVMEVADQANLSSGMISKIERGVTAPSLNTLQLIAEVLNVPVSSFFNRFEKQRDCTFVKKGKGLPIQRRGSRSGHQYELLGHNIGKNLIVEPYIITFNDESEVFPLFEHPGVELIYLLEGKVLYRHCNQTYLMEPGDSLYFDPEAPHGPADLIELPIKILAVLSRVNSGD